MAHTFNMIPAKPTFGTVRENLYQSDYLNRKKGIITYCNSLSRCQRPKAPSYNTLNLFNLTYRLNRCNVAPPINKRNLIIAQYTKENLIDVCTVSSSSFYNTGVCNSVSIDPTKTFYENYVVDPLGELFGNSQCGELNYTDYMI